eukprot:scaffold1113_cov158-Alexandrium_tamarense.AAC.3
MSKPFCEKQSHAANSKVPLVVTNETRDNLNQLNAVDIKLYRELSDCLNKGHYAFGEWQPDRFAVESFNATEAKIRKNIAKAEKKRLKTAKEG